MNEPMDVRVMAVKNEIKEAQNAARSISKAFMRAGRNRWIDISINEGWSYNVEEHARSLAFATWKQRRSMPTVAELDIAIKYMGEDKRNGTDDLKYYRAHGRSHSAVELADIRSARSQLTETNRRMMGDDA